MPPVEPREGDRGIPSRIPPGTAIIIAIAVFAAAVQEIRADWLLLAARSSERLTDGHWWRIVTALFAYDGGSLQKLGTVFGALARRLATWPR